MTVNVNIKGISYFWKEFLECLQVENHIDVIGGGVRKWALSIEPPVLQLHFQLTKIDQIYTIPSNYQSFQTSGVFSSHL